MAVVRDLMTATRIENLVLGAGGTFRRIDDPSQLPPGADVDVLVVDWSERTDDWAEAIPAWRRRADNDAGRRPDVIVFGPHTDLEAHAAARVAGLGPMRARSSMFAELPRLIAGD